VHQRSTSDVYSFNKDNREREHNIGEMYNWILDPLLKTVEKYKARAHSSKDESEGILLGTEC
jgi:hypothetical protein